MLWNMNLSLLTEFCCLSFKLLPPFKQFLSYSATAKLPAAGQPGQPQWPQSEGILIPQIDSFKATKGTYLNLCPSKELKLQRSKWNSAPQRG